MIDVRDNRDVSDVGSFLSHRFLHIVRIGLKYLLKRNHLSYHLHTDNSQSTLLDRLRIEAGNQIRKAPI